MVKPILSVLCFFLFFQSGLFAQVKQQKATPEQVTQTAKMDSSQVLRYLKLAGLRVTDSLNEIIPILNKARLLARKLAYPYGLMMADYQTGIYFQNQENYTTAINYFNKAASTAEHHHLYLNLYDIYSASLNLYYYKADYTHAMDLAQKGLVVAEKMSDREDVAHYYNQIGFIYLKQEKADEAIKYYHRYLALAATVNNQMMIASAYDGLADGYLLKFDYQTSLNYLFKALAIYNKMPRGQKLDKKRMVFKSDRLIYTLFKLSKVYKMQGNNKEALRYSLIILNKVNKQKTGFNIYELASYYINMGDIYRRLKDTHRAGQLLTKGLLMARSIFHREDIRDACLGLSKNFAAQRRFDSAYHYQLLFTRLKDSIINEKVSQQINKLEVERKDREILLLNQQQKLKETEDARKNLYINFIIGFVTLIIIISFLLFYIKSGIKHQKLIFEKQLAIQDERQRISSDMHDDIGTGLSTMLIYINMLKLKLAGGDDALKIERIAALGTSLVDQMKEIVWALSPGNDKLDSLLLFVRHYFVLLFEPLDYDLRIDFPATVPNIELESKVRRNIFLCIKEALNNVIKHAGATAVALEVSIVHHQLMISVKDNGCGMPAAVTGLVVSGNGLNNITRRMKAINGKFDFFNNDGMVVCLQINLAPYPNG